MIDRKWRHQVALAAALGAMLVISGCGSSGPSWCKPASELRLVKGEPDQVSIDITVAEVAEANFVGSDNWLQQGEAAQLGSPALRNLAAQLKKGGCPAAS